MRQIFSKKTRQDVARALRLAEMTTDESLRRELLDIAAELMMVSRQPEAPIGAPPISNALRLVYDRDSLIRNSLGSQTNLPPGGPRT